jgi:succinate dehydrogenase/fumarate reductase cytochrome b subunit
LAAAGKKWFEYQRHVARVGSDQLPILYAVLLAFFVWTLAAHAAIGLGLFLAYVLARGVADPIRRSARWNWWREYPVGFLLAPVCAFVIDTAKMAGSIKGVLERVFAR